MVFACICIGEYWKISYCIKNGIGRETAVTVEIADVSGVFRERKSRTD